MLNTVEKVEILKTVPLFSQLETRDLVLIALVTSQEELPPNEILCEEGEEGDELFVLASGELEVLKSDEAGRESRVATIDPGHCVGELSLFSEKPRTATLRSTVDSSVLILSAVLLHELMLEHPRLGLGMIKTLVERYS